MDNPDQINEIFDAISYAKGASVIRMLAGHLGVAEFMKGEEEEYAHADICTVPQTAVGWFRPHPHLRKKCG